MFLLPSSSIYFYIKKKIQYVLLHETIHKGQISHKGRLGLGDGFALVS